MISAEKQYEFLTAQIIKNKDRSIDIFKMFIQMFSLIVGGAVWLSMQPHVTPVRALNYALLSNVLVTILMVGCVAMIVENLRVWRNYRNAQSKLGGTDSSGNPNIPLPRLVTGSIRESIMIVGIVASALLFCRFNPFSI